MEATKSVGSKKDKMRFNDEASHTPGRSSSSQPKNPKPLVPKTNRPARSPSANYHLTIDLSNLRPKKKPVIRSGQPLLHTVADATNSLSRAPASNGKDEKASEKFATSKAAEFASNKEAVQSKATEILEEENEVCLVYPSGFCKRLVDELVRDVTKRDLAACWNDICDVKELKDLLTAVILRLKTPGFFYGVRRPWNDVLMVGPSGAGKTMLGKSMRAAACGVTFLCVPMPSLFFKYRCDPEETVRLLFEIARVNAPTIIFLDDIDLITDFEGCHRVKSELISQMDHKRIFESKDPSKFVMVLAATSNPWGIDKALLRCFEERINIPLPNRSGRLALLKLHLGDVKLDSDVDLEKIADMLDGYSSVDIENVCREAVMMWGRKKLSELDFGKLNFKEARQQLTLEVMDRPVAMDGFISAIRGRKKSILSNDLERYARWTESNGRGRYY